ncbi:phage baseplate protein [Citrobacter freundii]|uniref:Dit-like phage tail protein N-terminal domain-containing protein n=1 Tax=Citrobacter portucalensis TaxID=1639133 RepID=A0AAJ1N794_9ENTR|nr:MULTISPECIES: hypothetical protein [Enterobacteriaceae]EBB5599876.1 hypothetical protein [Salmonella enterica]EBF9067209.1 hypothetical protein [Salmonella enterica]ECJ9987132.1 hypothetical protein [Salmonella enterica]EIT2877332.1 hypothetical protein [Salmonella enterica]EIV8901054.1 hypothetical protein [Salmonella enterica]
MADLTQYLGDRKWSPVNFLFNDTSDTVFRIDGTNLASMTFDCVDNEQHHWSNTITEFPVEESVNISDNIKPNPRELTLTGFISNTPISGLVDELVNFTDRFLNGRKRTQDAYNQLKALSELKIPVTVTTRYEVYENMGLADVSIVRSAENGDALVVDLVFRQINIVSTQTGTVPEGIGKPGAQSDNATKTRAGSKVDAGKSTGKVMKADDPNVPKPIQRHRSALLAMSGEKTGYHK